MANVQTAARSGGVDLDPFRSTWRLLTSVRFALVLIGFLALTALTGVLIPQLPSQMRGNPAAITAWLEFQHGRFGFLTEPMDRLGLFDIFRSFWFASGLALLVVSVCVCTANRLPPIWRNVVRPQTRVPDEYFERGQSSFAVQAPNAESLATELRRRRYKVSLTREGGTTYLFADRFPWSQLATFVSHLALILFIAGGLVTVLTAKGEDVFVAEGTTRPVFAPTDADHMQVYVEQAVGKFDATGFPQDFRSYLVVYQGGREVARGVTTVNRPLKYAGFKFHQAAYFSKGAALKVRDLSTGRVVYDEVVALTSRATAPLVVVRDAGGSVLLSDAIVPTDFLEGVAGTLITIPGRERRFWIGANPGPSGGGWQLVVFEIGNADGARAVIKEGGGLDIGGGLSLSFAGITSVPSAVVSDLPGADGEAVAELADGPDGKLLTVGPVLGTALALAPGTPVVVGSYEYTYGGERAFAGLIVRRDPGSTFIWLATGLFLLGLALTFYTPRRRLWGKIAAGEAVFRGLGGRAIAIEREINQAAGRAGAA